MENPSFKGFVNSLITFARWLCQPFEMLCRRILPEANDKTADESIEMKPQKAEENERKPFTCPCCILRSGGNLRTGSLPALVSASPDRKSAADKTTQSTNNRWRCSDAIPDCCYCPPTIDPDRPRLWCEHCLRHITPPTKKTRGMSLDVPEERPRKQQVDKISDARKEVPGSNFILKSPDFRKRFPRETAV